MILSVFFSKYHSGTTSSQYSFASVLQDTRYILDIYITVYRLTLIYIFTRLAQIYISVVQPVTDVAIIDSQ